MRWGREKKVSPDQAIYEARKRALGQEPAPFGELPLEEINRQRQEMREHEKAMTGEQHDTYGGQRMGGHS